MARMERISRLTPTIFISLAALITITEIILIQQGAARALFSIGAKFMAASSAWQACPRKVSSSLRRSHGARPGCFARNGGHGEGR